LPMINTVLPFAKKLTTSMDKLKCDSNTHGEAILTDAIYGRWRNSGKLYFSHEESFCPMLGYSYRCNAVLFSSILCLTNMQFYG
jgi:hypothetical protein